MGNFCGINFHESKYIIGNIPEFYFRNVKIFTCVFHVSKLFASISRSFHVLIVLSLSSTLNSLENLIIACCFPDSSAYMANFRS